MVATRLALYLHPIIHISCLEFSEQMKYNKKVVSGMTIDYMPHKEAAKWEILPYQINYCFIYGCIIISSHTLIKEKATTNNMISI